MLTHALFCLTLLTSGFSGVSGVSGAFEGRFAPEMGFSGGSGAFETVFAPEICESGRSCAKSALFAHETAFSGGSCAKSALFAHETDTTRAEMRDTLEEASVSAVRYLPVTRPSEIERVEAPTAVPLADVIRRFTGVQIKDYGGAGGLKTINVRSLGSEHVGIFLDGIQISNAQNMQVDLGRFATGSLEWVELYNGGSTSPLQTAREYAAAASVKLTSAKKKPGLTAGIRGGSLCTVNPSLSYTAGLSGAERGNIGISVSGDFLYSGGKYRYPYFDTTLVRENADIRALRLETQLFGNRGSVDSWQLRLYSYGSERGLPGPVIRRASGFPFSAERQADQDAFLQGIWFHDWSPVYATTIRGKIESNYTHYNTHPELNPMALPYNLRYRQNSAYTSFAQRFNIGSLWHFDTAVDYGFSALDGEGGGAVSSPRRHSLTGAASLQYSTQRFRFCTSLCYEGAWDLFRNPRQDGWAQSEGFRGGWMPSVAAYYEPSRALQLGAFAKRSFRMPSFNDLYYTLMGNSSLAPEIALQTGGELRLQLGSVSMRLAPYYNRVQGKIVAIPTISQFRWTMLNIGVVDIWGADSRVSFIGHAGAVQYSLCGRYSFQLALDHTDPESATYGNQIPYIPVHSGSVDASLMWRSWTLSTSTTITGARWSRTANTSDYYLAPWSVTDMSLGKSFPHGIAARLLLSNVFNFRYELVQGYPMPGTTVILEVSLAL